MYIYTCAFYIGYNFSDTYYNVVLFEDDYENPDNIRSLVYETFGCAVLDCGAPRTLCGQNWLDNYITLLHEDDQNKIEYSPTSSVFKFGNSKRIKANKLAQIPILIGSKKVQLNTDVVNAEIPLLFSRHSMKKAEMQLDTKNDVVRMLGETIKLIY